MKNSQKGFVPLVILIIIAVAAIGGGAYYVSLNNSTKVSVDNGSGNSTSTPMTSSENTNSDQTTSLKTYADSYLKITFKYPSNWKIEKTYRTTLAGVTDQVGVVIFPGSYSIKTVPQDKRIDIGGHQVSCVSLAQTNPEVECKTVGKTIDYPIYTASKDTDTLKVFNTVASSVINTVTLQQEKPKNAIVNQENTNWKVYTNAEYGFTFQYPSNWVISESKYYIQLSDAPLVTDSGNVIAISLGSGASQGISSNSWREERGMMGGIFFTKNTYFNDKKVSIYLAAGSEAKLIEDQILSTFKFTK